MAVREPSEPTDKFTPQLLNDDVPNDLLSVFARARRIASGEDPDFQLGERCVAIVTPGRLIVPIPVLPKDQLPPALPADMKAWLGSRPDIVVVSYTKLEALMDEEHGSLKCIPFLPMLCILGAAGHNVVVFEGHPSALEFGLRDADVLLIDSGMLPFLQDDWMKVAGRAMRAAAKVFVCMRGRQNLVEVIPASQPPGWLYREPDGEASYANCLLTILGKQSGRSVSLTTGGPVPDLRTLTSDQGELEWVAALPFQYDRLDAAVVITAILKFAGVKERWPRLIPLLKSQYALNARLAQKGGTSHCPFRLTLSGFGSRKCLEVLREDF